MTNTAVKKTNWVNGIDSIRFLLAMVVFLSHIGNPYVQLFKQSSFIIIKIFSYALNHLFCGAAAVTVFFVISGFVIHYPSRDRSNLDILPFLVRRWLRIGLPLIAVSFIANYFHKMGDLPLWSLYCELIYYTLYPILFYIKISWENKLLIAYLVSILFVVLYLVDKYFAKDYSVGIHFIGIYWYIGIAIMYLPCWLLGVLLAENIDKPYKEISWLELWGYRVITFIVSIIFFILKTQYHITYVCSLIFFALLAYKWLETEIKYYRNNPINRLWEFCGKFSYSLYLWHMLFIYIISIYINNTCYTYFIYIGFTILFSYIVYLIFEYPSHKLAKWIGYKIVKLQH